MSKAVNQMTLLILLITTLSLTNAEAKELTFQVSPNPAGEKFHLSGLVGDARVVIYDMQGKIMFDRHINGNEKIYLSNFKEGLYFLEVSTNDGRMATKLLKK